jgi:hypothetical protein
MEVSRELYKLYKIESTQEIRRDGYNFAVGALTILAALVGEMNGLLETRFFAITKDRPIKELIHAASQLVPKTLTLAALHNENDSSQAPFFNSNASSQSIDLQKTQNTISSKRIKRYTSDGKPVEA